MAVVVVPDMELAFKSFTNNNLQGQCVVVTDSSKGLRSTIIQHVYEVKVTTSLRDQLVPEFKTFSADEFRFYLKYDPAAYSDVRPARSDFLSCKTPMPKVFPGTRGLSFYDVCDKFELREKRDDPFAVDLSQLLYRADAVPAPAPNWVWAELRKGEVKVFCPGGLPEQTHFQESVCAEAPAQAPTVLHDQTQVHLCVTYDLYLASAPPAGAVAAVPVVGAGAVNYAVPAKMNAVTPLLEMFEDRSRPLVQVQVLFRLDVQVGSLGDLDGFKTAIQGRVDAVLANELNALSVVNDPLVLPVLTVDVKSYTVHKLKVDEKITSIGSFSRKHYKSTVPRVRNIIASHNLNVKLTGPMTVGHLFPCLRCLGNSANHRYYIALGTYLKAAEVGKRIQRGDANVKAFHLTLQNTLHGHLQTCIEFMRNKKLMTTGHFKLCKIAMNHNQHDNFMIAFAWVPGAAPPAVAPPVNVVTAAAAAAVAAEAAPPRLVPVAAAVTAVAVASIAAAAAAAQKAALVVPAPAPPRNRVQSSVEAAYNSANTQYGRITVGDKKGAKVVVDVVKAISDLLNVGGALPPSEMDSAKSFVAASCGVLGSIIKLCAAIAADPTKTKSIVKAATPAAAPAPGPAPATISAHLIAPIALRTLVNALPPVPDVDGAVQAAMKAVITLLKGLTAAVLRAVVDAGVFPDAGTVVSHLCPPSPQPVPPPAAAAAPAPIPAPATDRAYTPVFSIMNNDFFETLQVEANIHVSCDITDYDAIPPTADSFTAFCTQANTLVHQTATEFLANCAAEPNFVNFGVAKF